MAFSGTFDVTRPVIAWFAGDDTELKCDTCDKTEAGNAHYDYQRTATIEDDRRPFRCVTILGNLQQVCEVSIEVPRES